MKEPTLTWNSELYLERLAEFKTAFRELPTPPSYADTCFYHDHPHFLWRAELGNRTFYVYHPERLTQPGGGRRNHGFRIDHNKRYTTTYPNRAQFEHALYAAVDHHIDKLIKEKGTAKS